MRALLLASCLLVPLAAHAQAVPRWTATPELRIGSLDRPDYALTEVHELVVDAAGTLYVAQRTEGLIRVYDARGSFVRTIGGRGAGPGEFQDIGRMGLRGDTLWVTDFVQSRLSLFGPDGGLLDARTISGPLLEVSARPTPPSAMLPDGSIVGAPAIGSRPDVLGPLLHMDASGRLIESLGALTLSGSIYVIPSERGALTGIAPVQSHSLWDVSDIDSSIVLVHRPVPTAADSGHFRVEKLRSRSDTLFARRYRYRPRAVPRAFADSVRSELLGVLTDRLGYGRRQAAAALRAGLPLPALQVPITHLVAGRDGTIWLRRENLGARAVGWLVLDRAGRIIGSLVAPPGLTILEAQREAIWGVETDELGVPYVVRYRVREAG